MPSDPRFPVYQPPPPDYAGIITGGFQNALGLSHQLKQQEMQEQDRAALQQQRQAQAARQQQQAAQQQQEMKSQQVVDQLMNGAMTQDEEGAPWKLDRAKFEQSMVQTGNGHYVLKMSEALDKFDERAKRIASERNTAIAETIQSVHELGNTPGALQAGVAMLLKNRYIDPSHAQPLLEAADQAQSPEAIEQMLKQLGQGMPEYRKLMEAETTRRTGQAKSAADLAKIQAETRKLDAEATAGPKPTNSKRLVEVTEPDGTPGFRILDQTTGTLSQVGAEGVGPKRPPVAPVHKQLTEVTGPNGQPALGAFDPVSGSIAPVDSPGFAPKQPPQTPESMQLTEVTGPDGSNALANYSPRSGQLSPVQAPGFAPKQPPTPTPQAPAMRTVNVMVDGQPKVATFNPQSGRLTVDGEDITGRATPMQALGAPPNLQRADVEVDGQPAVANFNPREGKYTDTTGQDISARVRPKSAGEASGSDFDKFLATYARERGKTTATLSAQERLAGKKAWSEADDKPGAEHKDWVLRNGKAVYINKDEIRSGDLPYNRARDGQQDSLRNVTATDAGKLADYNTSLNELKAVKGALTAPGAAKQTGYAAKAGAMAPNMVTEMTGFGAEAKAKQATIDRVKQVIGKTLEGGVLRKEDEAKYGKILPTIGDPPDLVASKLQGLETAILQRKQEHLDALADAGYDVSRFTKRANAAPVKPAPKVGDKVGRFEIVGVK